jgi:hypothetical protein
VAGTPLYAPFRGPPKPAPTDEAVLEKITAYQDEEGPDGKPRGRNPYQRLARYYGVAEDNPKLYQLAGKLFAKGIDANEWLDAKIGTGEEPKARPVGPVDPRGMRTSVEPPPGDDSPPEEAGFIRNSNVRRRKAWLDDPLGQGAADTRQLARGADRALFKVPTKIATAISGKSLDPTEEEDAARSPGTAAVGQIAASIPTGGILAKPFMAATNPLVSAAANYGRGAGTLAGAAQGVGALPVVAGGMAGAQAAVDAASGEGRLGDVPGRAYEGAKLSLTPPNILVAAALGGAGGYARGVRQGNTQTGEDIRLRDEYGGRPSITRGAKGGAFDHPGIAERRGTSADVGALSRESNDAVLARLNARDKANQASYTQRRDEFLASPAGQKPVDITDDVNAAIQKIESNPQLPLSTRQATTQEIVRELSDDPLLKPYWQGSRLVVPPEMLNHVRQRFDALAQTNQPGQDAVMRGTAEKLRDVADKTGWDKVNKPYAEETENLKRGHQLLGLKNTPRTKEGDIAASKKGARVMRRAGENTVTGGLEQKDMDEFVQRFPELRDTVAAPRLLAAKNRLSFGTGEGGTLYTRMQNAIGRNVEPLEANVLEPLGRRLGQAAPFTASTGNAIVDAYIEYQRRQEEMARLLKGGGR